MHGTLFPTRVAEGAKPQNRLTQSRKEREDRQDVKRKAAKGAESWEWGVGRKGIALPCPGSPSPLPRRGRGWGWGFTSPAGGRDSGGVSFPTHLRPRQ